MLPSATSTFWPSSVISIMLCLASSASGNRDLAVGGRQVRPRDLRLELVAKVLDHGAHRHGRRVAERADGAALDVVGHGIEQVDVVRLAVTVLDAVHHAPQPARAFAAGRALAAGL